MTAAAVARIGCVIPCQPHGREGCPVARCVVLGSCWGQLMTGGGARWIGFWAAHRWALSHQYPVGDKRGSLSQLDISRFICARLIAWVRWPGQLVFRAENPSPTTIIGSLVARRHHPLAEMFGDEQARLRLVRGNHGADWGALFVLCDYLADTGLWTAVHRWRPPAAHSLEGGMSLLLDRSSRGRIPLAETANLLADA